MGKKEYMRDYNFCPGPCIMPESVMEQARDEMMNWRGSGTSINEMNHRGPEFTSIAKEAEADIRELLSIPDKFKVFFLQGGATNQYAAVAMNLLNGHRTANYLTTGFWGVQCIGEAAKWSTPNDVMVAMLNHLLGQICLTLSTRNIDKSAPYFVYVENETANGFEFNEFPHEVIPEGMTLVADMSSNIGSKPIDWSKYGVVYAGAQKNLGPSGMTILIVREDLIGKQRADTPMMLDWKLFADAPVKFFNTPATWPIYVAGLNFKYMLKEGGIKV